MAKKNKSPKTSGTGTIARNKRASYDYKIEQKYEAGLVLQGWEIKSLRDGRVQLTESHVQIYKMEAWLMGCQISPLINASTHVVAEAQRRRKLLLHRRELAQLIGLVERKGYTIVPLSLYWKGGRVKIEIGVGKGKKEYDKRAAIKDRDWQRDKARHIRVN